MDHDEMIRWVLVALLERAGGDIALTTDEMELAGERRVVIQADPVTGITRAVLLPDFIADHIEDDEDDEDDEAYPTYPPGTSGQLITGSTITVDNTSYAPPPAGFGSKLTMTMPDGSSQAFDDWNTIREQVKTLQAAVVKHRRKHRGPPSPDAAAPLVSQVSDN